MAWPPTGYPFENATDDADVDVHTVVDADIVNDLVDRINALGGGSIGYVATISTNNTELDAVLAAHPDLGIVVLTGAAANLKLWTPLDAPRRVAVYNARSDIVTVKQGSTIVAQCYPGDTIELVDFGQGAGAQPINTFAVQSTFPAAPEGGAIPDSVRNVWSLVLWLNDIGVDTSSALAPIFGWAVPGTGSFDPAPGWLSSAIADGLSRTVVDFTGSFHGVDGTVALVPPAGSKDGKVGLAAWEMPDGSIGAVLSEFTIGAASDAVVAVNLFAENQAHPLASKVFMGPVTGETFTLVGVPQSGLKMYLAVIMFAADGDSWDQITFGVPRRNIPSQVSVSAEQVAAVQKGVLGQTGATLAGQLLGIEEILDSINFADVRIDGNPDLADLGLFAGTVAPEDLPAGVGLGDVVFIPGMDISAWATPAATLDDLDIVSGNTTPLIDVASKWWRCDPDTGTFVPYPTAASNQNVRNLPTRNIDMPNTHCFVMDGTSITEIWVCTPPSQSGRILAYGITDTVWKRVDLGGGGGGATEAYVDAAIAGLVAAAPGALNTLDELAAALGDDSNYAATVTTALAGKVPAARTIAGLDLTADIAASSLRIALSLVIGTNVQAYNAALAAIAGLSPSADDFLQYKSGAWANRTLAQVRTDLGLGERVIFDEEKANSSSALFTVPISGTWRKLRWELSGNTQRAATSGVINLTLNGDTGANYCKDTTTGQNNFALGSLPDQSTNTNRMGFARGELYLQSGMYPAGQGMNAASLSTTPAAVNTYGLRYDSTTAITSMEFNQTGTGAAFTAGTRLIVWGTA